LASPIKPEKTDKNSWHKPSSYSRRNFPGHQESLSLERLFHKADLGILQFFIFSNISCGKELSITKLTLR